MAEKLRLSRKYVKEVNDKSSSKEYEIDVVELNKQGYIAMRSGENVVDTVVLDEGESAFFERCKDLSLVKYEEALKNYTRLDIGAVTTTDEEERERLLKAYFCGYTPKKKDPRKYYIHFKGGADEEDKAYLNVNRDFGGWFLSGRENTNLFQTQFDEEDFDRMKRMELYKGINFEELKVPVPKNELGIGNYDYD